MSKALEPPATAVRQAAEGPLWRCLLTRMRFEVKVGKSFGSDVQVSFVDEPKTVDWRWLMAGGALTFVVGAALMFILLKGDAQSVVGLLTQVVSFFSSVSQGCK